MENLNKTLLTSMQIADLFEESPQRINYVIRQHRIKPDHRVGIIRLFGLEKTELIKKYLAEVRNYRRK